VAAAKNALDWILLILTLFGKRTGMFSLAKTG
jgi:hypothetical protein